MRINWYGAFGSGQGYSGIGENMVRALERLGVDVRIVSYAKNHESTLSDDFKAIRQKPFKNADIGIFFGFPAGFDSLEHNQYKIGYTMFETDRLPNGVNNRRNDWAGLDGDSISKMNKLDELWVPCEHNKRVFRENGVTIPIYVLHQGVDNTEYKPLERRHEGKPFTFLMLGTLTLRKNPGAVLSAFMSAFGDDPNVKMVFKTQSGTMRHIQLPNKNIKIIDELYPREKVMKLYKQADCFVFPTRGEGFGLPPVEAMATGLPVILADHSGMADFCDDEYNYPIRENVETKAFGYPKGWGNVGNWFEPSFQELKTLMKHVYENQDEARAKGLKASEWVRNNWTTEHTAQAILNRLKVISSNIKES